MSNAERTARGATTDYAAAIEDITSRGAAAIRGAKSGVDDVVAEATDKGREALDSARDVRDSLANVVIDSIRTRPYTTLAIAGAIGFIYGAMRRR